MIDHRPGRPRVIQTCDVIVDRSGLIHARDYDGGLSIMEWTGEKAGPPARGSARATLPP